MQSRRSARSIDTSSTMTVVSFPEEIGISRPGAARAHLLRGGIDPEPEETVHGLAAHVEGRDSGGGEDHRTLRRVRAKVLEQGRLSRPRLAGDEQVPFARFHQTEGARELRVDLHRHRSSAAAPCHYCRPPRVLEPGDASFPNHRSLPGEGAVRILIGQSPHLVRSPEPEPETPL